MRSRPGVDAGLALALACALLGCSGGDDDKAADLPYAVSVEAFSPGEGAGFGQNKLPGVVLGPPQGKGTNAGSLDVLSLGAGGEIVLGFGDALIEDGPGPDFIVFENAFWPNGDASRVYAELGEVSVSEDGLGWTAFPCASAGDGQAHFAGCAGWSPTLKYDPLTLIPLDPSQTGGDAFDLAELDLTQARFVKIRDLKTLDGASPSAGFDLDAIGVIAHD
jgi:hypothetical protein